MLHVLSYCAALEYIYLAASWAVESFPLDVDHACSMDPNPVYLCTHVIHIRCAAMKGQRAPKQVSPWRNLLRQSLIRCSPWIVQTNWHGTSTLTSQAPPTRSLTEARVWEKMSSCTSKFHYNQIVLLSLAAWHGIDAANLLTAYEPSSSDAKDAQISCLHSAPTGDRVRRCWISKCGGHALATHVIKFHTSDSTYCWSRWISWRRTEMIRFYTNPDVLPLPTSLPILQFRRPSMYSDCCSNTYV